MEAQGIAMLSFGRSHGGRFPWHYGCCDSRESTSHVPRETGRLLLPTRRRIDLRACLRGASPAWRAWPARSAARAERTADGRVHVVVVRSTRRGLAVRVTGVGAAHAEVLAPIAARLRRAFALDEATPRRLRGTSAFEDAALAIVAGAPDGPAALLRLGARCPGARSLRVFPAPSEVLRRSAVRLARVLGCPARARRLHALARALVAVRPPPPSCA